MICVLCGDLIGRDQLGICILESMGGYHQGSQYTGYSAHKSCTKLTTPKRTLVEDSQLRALISFNLLAKED
jgi:hypothetical protein